MVSRAMNYHRLGITSCDA